MRRSFGVFASTRLQPPTESIIRLSHGACMKISPKARQIDDFDYNIWLKHQNKYDARKEWRIFVSMAICQMFEKGEARFISLVYSLIPRRMRDELNLTPRRKCSTVGRCSTVYGSNHQHLRCLSGTSFFDQSSRNRSRVCSLPKAESSALKSCWCKFFCWKLQSLNREVADGSGAVIFHFGYRFAPLTTAFRMCVENYHN